MKNKQAWTQASPKRKKGEALALFPHFCASVAIARVHPNATPTQLPGTLTHPLALTDLVSVFTGPNSSLQQPPLSDRSLSLTVANSYLLITIGLCLSSSSSGLVGNLAGKLFVWASHQNRQRSPLTGTHPHPLPQNECPPSCHI